jgi:integrase/recombinase XerD
MNNDIIILDNNELQNNNDLNLERLVDEFLAQHSVRKNSRDRYRKSLRQFLNWFKGKNADQITKASILEYKEHLMDEKLSPLTIGAYLVAIRLFYVYLEEEYGIKNIAKNIASPKKENKFKKRALSEAEAAKLLDHFRPTPENKMSLRDYAIINLMLRTGMRTIEVVRANISDIGLIDGVKVLFLHGKGRDDKSEHARINDKALEPLRLYIESREGCSQDEPLFVSEYSGGRNHALTTKTISRLAREGLDAIGLTGKEYTAHSLRHTAGSIMLARGVALEHVKSVLRHKNISTTLGYVHMADEKKRMEENPEGKLDDAF